jgi:hypothetical protein
MISIGSRAATKRGSSSPLEATSGGGRKDDKMLTNGRKGRISALIANLKAGDVSIKQSTWADKEERRRDNEIFAIAMLGLLLMVAQLHFNWDGRALVNNGLTTLLKALVSTSTLLLLVRIVALYRFKAVASQQGNLSETFSACHSKFRTKLLIELFLNLVHTPPFMSVLLPLLLGADRAFYAGTQTPMVADKFSLFMFVRLYHGVRCIRDRTAVFKHRARIQVGLERGLAPDVLPRALPLTEN